MFIRIHGEAHIFMGDRPRDAAQSLNRLEMATSISSAARFARDSRHGDGDFHRPDGNRGAARLLQPTTRVANLFRGRYAEGERTRVICGAAVEGLLDALSDEAGTATTDPGGAAKKGQKGKKTKGEPAGLQHLMERRWSNTHIIGPLQLLALIRSRLCEEEPVILFNYFGMHRRSMEILRLIRAREHHKFAQYFTPRYMPDESLIANLVILVHHVARGSAQTGAQMGLARGSGEMVVSRIVMSCGDVMRDYLRKNGDAGCRELRIFCRNKAQLRAIEEGSRQDEKVDEKFVSWVALEDVLGPVAMASLMTGVPMA